MEKNLDTADSAAIISDTRKKFLRYLIVGVSTFLFDIGLLYGLVEIFKVHYLIAATLAWFSATIANYLLNKIWSFKPSASYFFSSLKYVILLGANYLFTIFMMYVLVEIFLFYYVYAKITIMAAIACWNFFIYKHFIFR